jgi:hypothetical protein
MFDIRVSPVLCRVDHWTTDNLCKSLQAVRDERSSSIEQRFRLHVADAGFSGPVEWLHDEGHPNDLLASPARYFDICSWANFRTRMRLKPRHRDRTSSRIWNDMALMPAG